MRHEKRKRKKDPKETDNSKFCMHMHAHAEIRITVFISDYLPFSINASSTHFDIWILIVFKYEQNKRQLKTFAYKSIKLTWWIALRMPTQQGTPIISAIKKHVPLEGIKAYDHMKKNACKAKKKPAIPLYSWPSFWYLPTPRHNTKRELWWSRLRRAWEG